jgi:pentatricopeptide repeat protein
MEGELINCKINNKNIDRGELISLNNEISLFANRKELISAMTVYQQMIERNIANSHTYAAILNANIRCGNIDQAEKIIKDMCERGRKLDVIICTTMMKGYCSHGLVI